MINFFHKYVGCIAAIIVSIFVFSCSTVEPPSNKKPKQNYFEKTNVDFKGKKYNTFYNGVEGYEILVPNDWLHKNNKNTALTLYTEKINDTDFVESLDLISHQASFQQLNNGDIKANKIDFNNFFNTHLNDLTENSKLQIASKGEGVIKNSKWVLFKTSNLGEKLYLLKYFIGFEDRIYILTGTCKEKDYPIYGPQFNDIISSFKPL